MRILDFFWNLYVHYYWWDIWLSWLSTFSFWLCKICWLFPLSLSCYSFFFSLQSFPLFLHFFIPFPLFLHSISNSFYLLLFYTLKYVILSSFALFYSLSTSPKNASHSSHFYYIPLSNSYSFFYLSYYHIFFLSSQQSSISILTLFFFSFLFFS